MSSCNKDKCDCGGDACCDHGATKTRLAGLAACEPWCGNNCEPKFSLRLPAIYTFLAALGNERLKHAGFKLCDIDGRPGVSPLDCKGDKTMCVPLDCDDPCALYGPHANREVRDSDISPTSAKAIVAAFEEETLVIGAVANAWHTDILPVPNRPGWYMVGVGSIGLSHKFCVTGVSAVAGTTQVLPVPVQNVRIAGSRIACSADNEGEYEWVIDWSKGAKPSHISVTDYRCACKNLCALTPSRGLEWYQFYLPSLAIGDLLSLVVTIDVERCDFMVIVDKCVGPVGNRLTFASRDVVPFRRVEPGSIPVVP